MGKEEEVAMEMRRFGDVPNEFRWMLLTIMANMSCAGVTIIEPPTARKNAFYLFTGE